MDGRVIAIGDVHGCCFALEKLLEWICPQSEDTLVLLGDYVNRGPNGPGVLDRLIQLQRECHLVALLGNHDEMVREEMRLHFLERPEADAYHSGEEVYTVAHHQFFEGCVAFHETETHLFMHASYDPELPMCNQDPEVLIWQRHRKKWPPAHQSGKTVVVGHTPQRDGEILDLGHVICLDTYCWGGGWLTGFDVQSRQSWQVDRDGRRRVPSLS